MNTETKIENRKAPWNKGKLVGQKLPFVKFCIVNSAAHQENRHKGLLLHRPYRPKVPAYANGQNVTKETFAPTRTIMRRRNDMFWSFQ